MDITRLPPAATAAALALLACIAIYLSFGFSPERFREAARCHGDQTCLAQVDAQFEQRQISQR